MRKMVLLAAVLLVATMLSAQSPVTMPVLVTHPTTGRPPSPAEKKIIDQLETSLADAIQEQMPCAVPTTSADLKDKYNEARSRQSASDDENDDLARMASSVGARDIIRVTVRATGDKYAVDVVYLDARTTQAQARSNAVVDGSDASLDQLAQQFADALRAQPRFANASCAADREWSGVIRYSFHAEPTSDKAPTKECTGFLRSKEDWKYSVRIPAVGEPTAMVFMSRLVLDDSECKRKIWCGKSGWVDEVHTLQDTKQWIGAAPVKARVSFDTVQGKLYLSVDLPQFPTTVTIEGESRYHSECAAIPEPKKTSMESTLPLFPRAARVPPQTVPPGQKKLSGSATDKDGGMTSWQLLRTNKK